MATIMRNNWARPEGCQAENPLTCRTHKGAAQAKVEFYREVQAEKKRQEENQFWQRVLEDLDASLNLRQQKDGSWTATVYRAGPPNPPAERGVEKDVYLHADRHAPEGRQGRSTGVFASPSLGGVSRWVQGIMDVYKKVDVRVRRITVNPDTTYIYPVNAWERVGWYSGDWEPRHSEQATNYWNSGITLSEWVRRVKAGEKLNPADWEMLLPPDVAEDELNRKNGVKIMPPKKVADQAYHGYSDHEGIYRTLTGWAKHFRQKEAAQTAA